MSQQFLYVQKKEDLIPRDADEAPAGPEQSGLGLGRIGRILGVFVRVLTLKGVTKRTSESRLF